MSAALNDGSVALPSMGLLLIIVVIGKPATSVAGVAGRAGIRSDAGPNVADDKQQGDE